MTPDGWRAVRFSEVAQFNPEQLGANTPADEGIAYLDIASIYRPGVMGSATLMRFGDAPSRARRRVRDGDLLVSTVRPYLRAFARVANPPANLVVSTGFAVMRPSHRVDGEFLFQHVLSPAFIEFLQPRLRGGSYPAVGAEDVAAFPLPLPPLPEQRKIAAILSSVDDAIEATQRVIDQLQVVKKAMMAELLTGGLPGRHKKFKMTEIGEVPEEWRVAAIGDLADFSGGNGFRPGDWSTVGLPIVRIQNLNGSQDFNYFASRPDPAWLVEPGQLLFAWAGSRGASFGPCIWPGPRGVLNQHIHRIVPRHKVRKMFLFYLLRVLTAEVEKRAHGFKDTLLHLKKAELTGWKVALPPLDEQDAIVAAITTIEERVECEKTGLACLIAGKNALMSVLLTGEVRVKPDEDAA